MKPVITGLVFLLFSFCIPSDRLLFEQQQRLSVIRQIPVITYHNISQQPAKEDALFISAGHFDLQMKAFYNKGYHAILPDQLAAYYQTGTGLPSLPFMITFDDAHVEQYTLALPILEKYQFKAVFFVMTVCIDKKGFLSAKQIASLSSRGHAIGVHTWDHPNMTKQRQLNWKSEIDKPKKRLEEIIGKPINCFAFPYGAWNVQILQGLKQRGFTTAYQLQGKQSADYPLLTIRRIMVNGAAKPEQLIKQVTTVFQ